jgi:hypothetical protein
MYAYFGFVGILVIFAAVIMSVRNAVIFRKNCEAYADKCVDDWRAESAKWERF